MTVLLVIIALAGYLLGSIPTGLLVGKARGIDIRQHGSGNIGATNVSRTLGKKLGIFVFVCDTLKGVLAVRLGIFLSQYCATAHHGSGHFFLSASLAGILGGITVILGHNFPVWLKFKGGKGVATSLGMVIGLVPLAAAVALAVWIAVFLTTRYVSLASILGAIAVPVMVAFTVHGVDRMPLLLFNSLAALLIVARHRSNIQRLLAGTENRFEKKKP
jgi:acyl phosphate:glycerol-3-phosphate acyltransferase